MTSGYDKICAEIDEEFTRFCLLYDRYLDRYAEMGNLIRDGHFNLSKAKYSLGSDVVSPLSFDMNMKAKRVVQIDCNKESDGLMLKEVVPEDDDGSSDEEKRKKKADPLTWYGMLPPLTLRNAQTNFTDALQVAVELADLKHKMAHCYENYERLIALKDKSKFSI